MIFLLPRFGSLGIPIFSENGQKEYRFSSVLSKNLIANIINQKPQFATNPIQKRSKAKNKINHNEKSP